MRFNLNPNFGMSLKSFRYPSNSTSFRSPQFTKMPGTGGTGAYGDVSDGQMIFYMLNKACTGTCRLTVTVEQLQTVRRYNSGNSLYWQLGAGCGRIYAQVGETEYLFQSNSHDSSSCGIINPEWLYQVTSNCTKPITFVSVRGSCTNPWSGFGFASGSRHVKGFNMPKAHYDGHPFNYKTSILTKTTSTYESVYYDCPRSVKIWI